MVQRTFNSLDTPTLQKKNASIQSDSYLNHHICIKNTQIKPAHWFWKLTMKYEGVVRKRYTFSIVEELGGGKLKFYKKDFGTKKRDNQEDSR